MKKIIFFAFLLLLLSSCSGGKMEIPLENGNVSVGSGEINYSDETSNISASTGGINGNIKDIGNIGITQENIKIGEMDINSSGVSVGGINTNDLFLNNSDDSEVTDIENDPFFQTSVEDMENDPFFNQESGENSSLNMGDGSMNLDGNTMSN